MVSGPLAASAASLIEIDHFHVIFELRPNGLLKTVAVVSRTAMQEQNRGLSRLRPASNFVPELSSVQNGLVLARSKRILAE